MNAPAVDTVARQRETKVCPSSEPALDVGVVRSKAKIKNEAERDAARLLRVTSRVGAPVDCAAIANELGLHVFVTMLKEVTLGGLLLKPGDEPKIFVNRRDGYLRQRFACALELGHHLRRSAERRANTHGLIGGDPVPSLTRSLMKRTRRSSPRAF